MKKLILLFISTHCFADTNTLFNIDYSSQMTINVIDGTLSLSGSGAVAHCPTPHINFLDCGSGTFRNVFNDCQVLENDTPIEIDYEVDDVVSCEGVDGTAEWRGPLQPFSGGSGTFSKSLPSGISETTVFGINCQLDNTFAYTGQAKFLRVSNIHITPGYVGMLKWVGDQLHVVRFNSLKTNQSIEHNGTRMAHGHRPYLVVSDEKPIVKDGQLISFKELPNNGSCSILGDNIEGTQVNVAENNKLPNSCVLTPNKQYYLLQILFETK